jgi:hypothetical protein
MLRRHPEAGRPGRVSGTRELVVSGTTSVCCLSHRRNRITILRVLHGARPLAEVVLRFSSVLSSFAVLKSDCPATMKVLVPNRCLRLPALIAVVQEQVNRILITHLRVDGPEITGVFRRLNVKSLKHEHLAV